LSSRVIKSGRLLFSSPMMLKLNHTGFGTIPVCTDAVDLVGETEEVVRELLDKAQKQAQTIITAARQEVARLEEEAERDRASRIALACEQGFNEGMAEARKVAEAEKNRILADARLVLEQARAKRGEVMQESEQELVELALAIARKVIDLKLEEERKLIVNIARQALARAAQSREITLRVNPDDYDEVISAQGNLDIPVWQKVDIEADPAVEAGGCVIDTGSGLINAQIDRQMAEIREALLGVSMVGPGEVLEGN